MAVNPIMSSLQGNMYNPIGGFGATKKAVQATKKPTKQTIPQATNLGNIRAIPQVQPIVPMALQIDTNHSFFPQITPGVRKMDIGGGNLETPQQAQKDIKMTRQSILQSIDTNKSVNASELHTLLDPLPEDKRKQFLQSLVDNGVNIDTSKEGGNIADFGAGMGQESVSQLFPKLVAGGLDIVGADKARDFVLRYAKFADEEDKKTLKRMGIDPDTGSFKAGATTSDVAVPAVASLLAGGPAALAEINNIANPLLRIGLKSALGGAGGVAEMNLYTAATEGRGATKEENTFAGLLGGGLPALGAAAGAIKKGVQSVAPKRQLSGLLNGGRLKVLKDALIDEGTRAMGKLEASDVGKWMLARGFKGSKDTIIENLINYSDESKGLVDDLLGSSKTLHTSDPAKKAVQNLYDDVVKTPGLEEEATQLQNLLGKEQYTLVELNQIKRRLDDAYNLYTRAGGESAGLKAKGLRNIRQKLRQQIEDAATAEGLGDIKMLNNETSIARGLAEAISTKEASDTTRELVSFFTKGAAGAGLTSVTGGPFDGNTTEGKIGNFIVGWVGGELAGSTAAKTTIASWLRGLSGIEKKSLQRLIETQGKEALSKGITNKITKLKQALDTTTKDGASNINNPIGGANPGLAIE